MTALVLGLLLFLGVHSLRIFADGWRSTQVARLGERSWKGLY
ncbi:MAG: NnrU family protein, partial [Pseudomonadota bacterium]